MTYVLDTHPVVWFLESSRRPSVRAGTVLRDPSHVFILPTVVLVEITYLFTKGRIDVDTALVRQRLVAASNCVLYPLDEQVVMRIPMGLNIHDAISPGAPCSLCMACRSVPRRGETHPGSARTS